MFSGGIGIVEILTIFLIIFIIFGAGKLPQLGEGLGKGIRSFKKEVAGTHDKKDKVLTEKNH